MHERKWIDIEPAESSLSACEVSKKVTFSTSTTRKMERFNSGELKNIFRVNSHRFFIGLTIDGKHAWQQGGGAKRRVQYCTDDSGISIYLRAIQGHSGRNLIDLSLQDNMIIQSGFFQHIYHIERAF